MQIPLTESVIFQRSTTRIGIPEVGSPRSDFQVKSMENTLNLRLFSEKKKSLFKYDVSQAKPIQYKRSFTTPLESQQPKVSVKPPEKSTLRIYDIAGKAKRVQSTNTQIDEKTLFEPKQSYKREAYPSTPFKVSNAKQNSLFQGLALRAAVPNANVGFFDSFNIFNGDCCKPDPDSKNLVSPTHYFSTPVKTAPVEDNSQLYFNRMSPEKVSPKKYSVYKAADIIENAPISNPSLNYSIPMNMDNTYMDRSSMPYNKKSFLSGADIRRSLDVNARGELVDLEYYNQKLPSHKRLEVYEGSPKKFPSNGRSTTKNQPNRSKSVMPKTAAFLLNDSDDSSSYFVVSPQKKSDSRQQDSVMGDLAYTPIEKDPNEKHYLRGFTTDPKTNIKNPRLFENEKPTPKQYISEIWKEKFEDKVLLSSKSRTMSPDLYDECTTRRILRDVDETQSSEIQRVQDTALKRTIPTEP